MDDAFEPRVEHVAQGVADEVERQHQQKDRNTRDDRQERLLLEHGKRLLQHGAILLRGFSVHTPQDFERCCRAFNPQLLNYVGGDSPREGVTGKVYTSTEYPPHLEIPLHNELSYRLQWPRTLFFYCQQPPLEGGATNLADGRRILQAIEPAIRERFPAFGSRREEWEGKAIKR